MKASNSNAAPYHIVIRVGKQTTAVACPNYLEQERHFRKISVAEKLETIANYIVRSEGTFINKIKLL